MADPRNGGPKSYTLDYSTSVGYCDRLAYAYLNLDSLFNGPIKSDLLLCYKFLAGHADVDVSRFFTRVTDAKLCSTARDSNFFANIVSLIFGTHYKYRAMLLMHIPFMLSSANCIT